METLSPKLPGEIVMLVLESLDGRTLIKCRLLSRALCGTIDKTKSLQYNIHLSIAGQVDGCGGLVSGRASLLRRREEAWDHLCFTAVREFPLYDGASWELSGNVLAQQTDQGGIEFRQLRSVIRGVKEEVWRLPDSAVDFPIADFAMDPSQDLLLIVRKGAWEGVNADHTDRFHLLTMSAGKPHPLAPRDNVLSRVQCTADPEVTYFMQIFGQYVAVLFSYRSMIGNELIVWNWMTGARTLHLSGKEIRSFVFLTKEYILVAYLSDLGVSETQPQFSASLAIIEISAICCKPTHIRDVPIRSLAFPKLSASAQPQYFTIRSDPDPAWKPHDSVAVPFHLAPCHRMFVVSFWARTGDDTDGVTLIVPLSTLRPFLIPVKSGEALSWEDWGPLGTRMFSLVPSHSITWCCYVYGTKYVAPFYRPHKRNYSVLVYDFNQAALMGQSSEEKQETHLMYDTDDYDAPWTTIETDVSRVGASCFKDLVETCLPYRVRALHIDKLAAFEFPYTFPMCAEDNLVLVNELSHWIRVLSL